MPPLVGGEQEIEPFEPHVGHGEEPCGAGAVHVVLPGTHYVGMGGTIGIKGAIPADIDALVRDLDAILSIPLEDLPVVVGRGDLDRSHALGDRPVEVGTAIINNEQVYGYVVAGGRNGATGPAQPCAHVAFDRQVGGNHTIGATCGPGDNGLFQLR